MGAHALHARGGTNTAAGTAAFLSRFEREVDPDGILPPAERARRADHARKAYFTGLALKGSQARRKEGAEADRWETLARTAEKFTELADELSAGSPGRRRRIKRPSAPEAAAAPDTGKG